VPLEGLSRRERRNPRVECALRMRLRTIGATKRQGVGLMNISERDIPALQALGYTEIEARFLYVVATHSGYFVPRQYLDFSGAKTKRGIRTIPIGADTGGNSNCPASGGGRRQNPCICQSDGTPLEGWNLLRKHLKALGEPLGWHKILDTVSAFHRRILVSPSRRRGLGKGTAFESPFP